MTTNLLPPSMSPSLFYLFVDVETTGLNPAEDHLLEVSAILTGSNFGVIGKPFHQIIKHTDWDIDNEYVLDMHTKNGLIVDCLKPGRLTRVQVRDEFVRWFHDLSKRLPNTAKIEFAGDSPHFDRAWLRVHLPGAWDRFVSHHHLDVSALGRVLSRAGSYQGTKSNAAHRAVEDNLDAIRRAKECFAYIEDIDPANVSNWDD